MKRICMALPALMIFSFIGQCKASENLEQALFQEAQSHFGYMQNIRRTLHAEPELMFAEQKTSAYIREHLEALDIPFKYPVAKTGIVATLGSGQSPKFALRSDIDALPILEEVDVTYKSKVDGKMHACGHDSHMAMLLGAAKILKARESEIRGTIVLLFQPAEEGGAGGKFMVEEGALEGVLGVHGIHVMPIYPSGVITSIDNTMMAGADEFHIEIQGRGGHAAMPHLTIDPIIAAASVVTSLQHLVSRVTKATEGAVISVSRFNTGEGATNVIPDNVKLGGTLRSLTLTQFNELRLRITQVAHAVAGAHACNATIEWTKIPYIPVVNSPKMVSMLETVAKRFGQYGQWERMTEPLMVGEDFAFLAEAVPGVFTYLGIRNETAGSVYGLHTSRFTLDETVLPRGAALHAAMAFEFLSSQNAIGKEEL